MRLLANSLGINQIDILNLFEDFKDGLSLLKIIDHLKYDSVDWSKAELKPANKF